jgi:hypothetical protein
VRTPAEEAERLADELRALGARLSAAEGGEAIFTKADVDRIVSGRLAREQKRTRRAEREIERLEDELEDLRGRQRREDSV